MPLQITYETSTYALRSSISPALPIAGGSAAAGAITSTGASIEGIAVSLDSPLISHTFNARVNPVQRGLGVTAGLKVLARTAVNLAVVYAAVMIVVLVKERVAAASSGGEDGVPSAVGVGVPGLTGASASLRLACGAVRSRSLKVLSVLFSPLAGLKPSLNHYARLAWGGLARARDGYLARTRVPCPPMDIKGDDWGVATLVAKEEAGGGGCYAIHTFAIPRGRTLPVGMAQKVNLCCLDKGDNVVRGGFHLANPRHEEGRFKVVGTKGTREDEGVWGKEKASLDRTLWEEVQVGDEVAIKPGKRTLEYRGQALPVTDMVYVCNGLGVVPMIGQAREVLNAQASSVKTCTVVWINERPGQFYQEAYKELEDEFYKHNRRLDVSCCLERDVYGGNLGENGEIDASVPGYGEGTMAVVAGPDYFVKKVNVYLQQRGYPADCICALG
ncbi:hypothetical protein TrRE_jg4552 [Triparma retinervis]|uniref:Uncharacterized protein n=1 Tax=Triparma retinervis TaxID=2557542 RepID=A0A9W7E2G9_9STRA|nr:hypothetical protein TrRE_jg4552 [Triparma retinervis]